MEEAGEVCVRVSLREHFLGVTVLLAGWTETKVTYSALFNKPL